MWHNRDGDPGFVQMIVTVVVNCVNVDIRWSRIFDIRPWILDFHLRPKDI